MNRPASSCLPGREELQQPGQSEPQAGEGEQNNDDTKKEKTKEASTQRPPSPWPKAARKAARLAALQREAEDAKTIEKLNREVLCCALLRFAVLGNGLGSGL